MSENLVRESVVTCVETAQDLPAMVASNGTSASAVFTGPDANGDEVRLKLDDTAPCAEPVEGSGLLAEIRRVFRKYVLVDAPAAVAVTLWVAWTYVRDAFLVSPILCFGSPDKRCGKTQAITVVSALVHKPLAASNVSPAGLFRVVDAEAPTLLVDEGDTFIRANRELRGILNAGHTRATAKVIRVVGGEHEPREFSTWCPKAVALIGSLPGTLADRSIVVRMRRKSPTDVVGRVSLTMRDELAPLRSRIERWAGDSFAALTEARPAALDGLNDRAFDNWTPLLAIADLAGGEWPGAARQAAMAMSPAEPDDENLPVALLRDLRTAFAESGRQKLFTEDLLSRLMAMEESPWRGMRGRQKLDPHLLARMLSTYEVAPRLLRVGRRVRRGYELADLRDAFTRYLPHDREERYTVTAAAGAACSGVTRAGRERAEGGDPCPSLERAAKEVAGLAQRIENGGRDYAAPREAMLASAASTFGVTCSRMLERRVRAGDPEAIEETRRLRDRLDGILRDVDTTTATATSPAEHAGEEFTDVDDGADVHAEEVAHAAV